MGGRVRGEGRPDRQPHLRNLSTHAIRFCLSQAHFSPDAIDAVAFSEKPFLKSERLIETYWPLSREEAPSTTTTALLNRTA